MIRRSLCIILLMFIFYKSYAQQSDTLLLLKGKVLDTETKLPVEGASIIASPARSMSISGEDGFFLLRLKKEGKQQLTISAIGYATKVIDVQDFVSTDETIQLVKGPLQLGEIVLAAGVQSKNSGNISKADILIRGINNSQEVLRIVPGLFIGQHAGGGKAEQIFLRGFDIDHGTDIHISVDGMPVNMVSHAHGQGYADLHFVIPELVEHVHFEKGTYEADKGNLATAGSVSFYTKTRLPASLSKVEAGMFNTYRNVNGVNLINKRKQSQSLYIASEALYSKGYFEHPQNFRRLNLFGKYFQEIGEQSMLVASAATFKSKWNASGQIPDRAVASGSIGFFGAIDPSEGGITGRSNMNILLKTTLNNNSYLKNQVYFSVYDFELYSNFTFFKVDEVNGDEIRQKENRKLFGYNGSFHQDIYLENIKWVNEIGASLRADAARNSELSRTKNRIHTLHQLELGDINELNTSAYVSQTIQWNEHFSLNGALRFDHLYMLYRDHLDNNTTASAGETIFSPKLNFTYQPNSKTAFYIKAGKGFHSNDARVTVIDGRKALPSAYGVDAGMQWKPGSKLLLDAVLWSLKIDQEFVYVGDEGILEEGGRTQRKGADLSIRYQPFQFLYIDGNFNYAQARTLDAPKGENYIPLAPSFTSSGGLTLKTKNGWNSGLYYRYMSDRPANENNSLRAKGYFITDAHLQYSWKKSEASITFNNLFNTRWKETQFETESRLKDELDQVSEIHFTPGTPLFIKVAFTCLF